jgi:hypothetical protein
MGYEEIPGVKPVSFKDLSAGWFPGKQHNDIPGSLDSPDPIGMADGNAVVWLDGSLKSFFGYDNVNTSAINSAASVTSLYASDVLNKIVGSCGDKLYADLDQASPLNITGAVVISAGNRIVWSEWQFETTAYVVGTNGVDPPFKWTGVGDATIIGGTPPTGKWNVVWNNALWIGRPSIETATLYFSDLADPEVWTANNDYKFPAPITGLGVLADKLVVFMDDAIGILSGYNNGELTKIDKFISSKGCTSGYSIVNAKLGGVDVLVFHSSDGWYAFDGSTTLYYLSSPIRNKYRNQGEVSQFTKDRFEYVSAEYFSQYNWVVAGMSDGNDSINNFMVILDLSRVYESKEGKYVPHWPVDNIPMNCIARTKSVTEAENEILFGDTTGFVYKFSPVVFNNNGASYSKFFQSKIFDNVSSWLLIEFNIMANESSTTLTTNVKADLEAGSGAQGSVSLQEGADLLGTTFILGSSVLGGKDFVFNEAAMDVFGRFLQFKISNSTNDASFSIEEVNIILQEIGLDPNIA